MRTRRLTRRMGHYSRIVSRFSIIAVLASALALPPAGADPGDLDPTFGTGGKTITNVGTPRNFAHAVAVQPDGKILIAGTPDGIALGEVAMAVTRFNTNGTLDDTFGDGGTTIVDMGERAAVNDMLLQSNGRIVIVGFSGPHADEDFAIARLTDTGGLDDTFSNDGKRTVDFYGNSDIAYAVARDTAGNYVLGGAVYDPARNEGDLTEEYNFGVTRLSDTGVIEDPFGTQGKVQTDIGSLGGDEDTANDALYDLVIQTNGAIVAGGTSEFGTQFDDTPFTLVRYTSTGALDNTFDGDGRVTTFFSDANDAERDGYVQELALTATHIVAVGPADVNENGNSNGTFSLARYSQTNGALDGTFGVGGKVSQPVGRLTNSYGKDSANALIIDSTTGKITVAGSDSGLDFAMARFNSNGTLDTSAPGSGTEFGTGGIVVDDLGGDGQMGDEIFDIAVDPTSGKFAVSGVGGLLGSAVAARYSTKGILDSDSDVDPLTFFGTAGHSKLTWGGNDYDYAEDLIELSDGDFLGVGYAYYGGPVTIGVVRYNADGTLDPAYGIGGISRPEIDLRVGNQPLTALEMDDGKVTLVTSILEPPTLKDVALVRLEENGQLDTDFGDNGLVRFPLAVSGNDAAADAVLLPDGKIVIAATVGNDVALARVHPDGTLDSATDSDPAIEFGTGGKTVVDVFNSSVDRATVLVKDGDSFLLAAKSGASASVGKFAVLRFTSSGQRVAAFGPSGYAEADFPGAHDIPNALVVQNDGKIIAGGKTGPFDFGSGTDDIALARFNTDGTLDTNSDGDPGVVFGTGGKVTTGVQASDNASDAVLLADGRILVVGATSQGQNVYSILALYATNGVLDSSFGNGGIATLLGQAAANVLLQGSDKAIVFGRSMPGSDIVDLLLERITLGPGDPVADRTMTLKTSKKTIIFGDKVNLSGNLTSTDTACKSAISIGITPTPGTVLQAITNASGAYSLNHKPKEKTSYAASVAAGAGCAAANAGPKVVKVAKMVTLEASQRRVEKDDNITLTAQFAPCAGKQGQDMTLKKKTTGAYSNVVTKNVNQSCKATWTQKITRVTTFQAVSPKQDPKHEGGTSPSVRITLK